MKQFPTVLKFEFLNTVRGKAFIGITIAVVLIAAIGLSYPRFTGGSTENLPQGTHDILGGITGTAKTGENIAILDLTGGSAESMLKYFSEMAAQQDFEVVALSEEALKQAVDNGEYTAGIIVEEPLKYKYITKNAGIMDSSSYTYGAILTVKYQAEALGKLGVSEANASEIMNAFAVGETVITGIDQTSRFFYTYIMVFLLYFAIIMYGQLVASSVAAEKSSRAMEVLITSASPNSLIFGKVFGSGLAGILQLAVMLGSAFFFYNLNQQYWGGNMVISALGEVSLPLIGLMIVLFVLGFFIYSFMFGAIGSLVSRVEELNTAIMPMTLLFAASFLIVMFSMQSGAVDSTLMIICSYIPFTSPMAMLARVTMSQVPTIEVIISIAVLVLSILIIGWLSAKIYKIGVLSYGKPPKLTTVIKAALRKEK